MKKYIKYIVIAFVLIIVGAFGIGYFTVEANPLVKADNREIKEIFIADPSSNYIVTEPEDIDNIIDILKDMKLYRRWNENTMGFSFMIDITYANNETTSITMSNYIRIDNNYYKWDKEYFEVLRKVYDGLSEKYVQNPA